MFSASSPTTSTALPQPGPYETDAAEVPVLDLGPLGRGTAATWQRHVQLSNGPAQDALLNALLIEASNGDTIAEEVLLQALVPALRRATTGLPSVDDCAPYDRAGIIIAAAWEAIRCHRPERNTHVFITLLREARHVLAPTPTANQRLIADRTTPVDTAELAEIASPNPARPVPAEIRLAAVLAWARDTRILTAAEIDLLIWFTLSGEPASDIADNLDTTVRGLRKRVQRIRARLTAAIETHQ